VTAAPAPNVWSFEPQVLVTVGFAAAVYLWRLRDLHASQPRPAPARDYLRAAAFLAGLAVLTLALVSPIDRLGEERLFCVHMAQHLLLTDVAPILLLLGLSRPLLRPATRRFTGFERALGPLAHPFTALALLIAALWIWHIPAMYELALDHRFAHDLEHLSFFGAGLAFWWYLIEPVPPRQRLRGMTSLAYIGSAKVALGALGIVLAFSPDALYDNYERAPRTWGLTAVEDLNVGGLVMMIEQMLVLVVFFAIFFVRMLEQSERAERRRERYG
jgi:cytochrome c oxidase assembly factor CtaG